MLSIIEIPRKSSFEKKIYQKNIAQKTNFECFQIKDVKTHYSQKYEHTHLQHLLILKKLDQKKQSCDLCLRDKIIYLKNAKNAKIDP